MMLPVLATYRVLPISWTPNGESSPSRKTCFSQLPSAVGRSRVMRLPPLPPLPDWPFTSPAISCLGVLTASVPGPLASTTVTSPFGRVSSWRGCSKPSATLSIFKPSATFGIWFCCQPTPFGTCIGGIKKFCAAGNTGSGPICCSGEMTALLSQPASASTAESAIAVDDSFMKTSLFCAGAHGQQYVGEAQQRDYDRRQHQPCGTTAYASRLCTKALIMARTMAIRFSQKCSLTGEPCSRLLPNHT